MGKSKPYEDRRDAPIRRYLLNALAGAKLNGTELAIILVIMDQTYGWQENKRTKRRKDRADIPIRLLSEVIGRSKSTISRYIKSLEEKNIIIIFEGEEGPNSRVIGIQSDPEKWNLGFAIANSKGSKKRTPRVRNSEPLGFEIANLDRSVGANPKRSDGANPKRSHGANPSVRTGRTLDRSERRNHAAGSDPNLEESRSNLDPQYVEEDDGRLSMLQAITSASVANKSELTAEEASVHAEKNFTAKFARSLLPSERIDLLEKMKLGDQRPGALLAVWIIALDRCVKERRESRGENRKTWKNIYLHVCDCFSRLYDEIKNGKQKPKRTADEAMGEYFATRRHNPWAKS